MPSTVTRRELVSDLAADGGTLNVNDLPPQLLERLAAAGVGHQDLKRIAGGDAQLRGEAEMGALFALLDRLDRNSSASSFRSSIGEADGPGADLTPAGDAHEGLKEEVARRREAASSQGVLYLGMRPAGEPEIRALQQRTPPSIGGVYAIRGAASDGVFEYAGRSFDLRTAEGLQDFREALVAGPDAIPADRADALMGVLGDLATRDTRDELAAYALALHRAGTGELPINRLVLSGHGLGDMLTADDLDGFSYRMLQDVARAFPEGAEKIEHLAISACYSAKLNELNAFREALPNLKSFWGYKEFSPKAETGAPAHLSSWAGLTDGDDPSRVDPKSKNVATWNVADGEQGFKRLTWRGAQLALRETEWVLERYRSGARSLPSGGRDLQLDRYYRDVQNALDAVDLPVQERAGLLRLRDEVLRLRHPELAP
jgi:hypothetical protein